MDMEQIIPIKNVIFVKSDVMSLDAYINSETICIGFHADTTTDMMMQGLLPYRTIERIGFAFHFSLTDNHSSVLFLNQEPFFTDSDLGESVDTFSPNVQFMLDLILSLGGGITHVDFLACGTLKSEKWRLFYQLLRLKTGVVIGASDDNTGNMKLGGDWIMESTHEEVGQIYFTAAIENWASLLAIPTALNTYYHTFYTINATTDANTMTRTIYNNTGTLLDTQNMSFGGMPIKDVLSLINGGGGTNPYAIGIVDSSLNKICMDIAFCGVYTKPWTERQKMKLMTYVNTTFKEPRTTVANTYVVTVNGNAFWLAANNGTAVASQSLLLTYGKCYLFDQSHSSNTGYQLTINTNSNYTSRYNTGVVTNGTPGSLNAYTLIDLNNSLAGATLYYGCVSLSGGTLYTSALSSIAVVSASTVPIGDTFSVTFMSNLTAGTEVEYSISGCTSANLNNALISGIFIAPSQVIQYTVSSGTVGNSISFLISGTVTSSILVLAQPIVYSMSISGGIFQVTDSDQITLSRPRLNFYSGNTYKFIQTDSTNAGHQIYFSTTPNGTIAGGTVFTTGVTVSGIPGQPGAFTTLNLTSDTPLFYCCDISGAGSSNLNTVWNVSNTPQFGNTPFYPGESVDDVYLGYQSICCSKDGKVIWLLPYNSNVYVSVNYGKTFILFGGYLPNKPYLHLMVTCDDTGYIGFISIRDAITNNGRVYKINYAANSFTEITSNIGITSQNFNIKINSTGSCLIVVSDSAIYKSTNLGASFTQLTTITSSVGASPGCIAMDSTGQYIASCGSYIGGTSSLFYKTVNYGSTWDTTFNNQPTNFPATNTTGLFQYAAYSYNGAALVVYIFSTGLFLSKDYGYTWTALASETAGILYGRLGNNGIISNPNFVLDISGQYLVYNINSSGVYCRKYDLLTNAVSNYGSVIPSTSTGTGYRNIMCSDAYLFNVYTMFEATKKLVRSS